MVITLINMGPMIGIMAIKAPNPANTCVNTPRISVVKTTIFSSTPYCSATITATPINIQRRIWNL
ncbi:uncharacterized protein METZ01_LOCUS99155 [marine metagenome]|uniref:Uncharacterized protein n=1 Tax=marine metagenome TaxID=408172 RepID=A0A381W1R0_9ZZZZ